MSRTNYIKEELAFEEMADLDLFAEAFLPKRDEIVTIEGSGARKVPVSITRHQIYKMATMMSSNSTIADMIGIDVNTLTEKFKKELKMGRAYTRHKLAIRFYNLAMYGNNPADRIFALKNWNGMSDNGLIEDPNDIETGTEFNIRRPVRPSIVPSNLYEGQEVNNQEIKKFDQELLDEAIKL